MQTIEFAPERADRRPGGIYSDQTRTGGSGRHRDSGRVVRSHGGGGAGRGFFPGDLVVSESFYSGNPGIVAGKTQLPPGCTTGCVTATAGGGYPQVFNNDLVDANFGVTSRIFLEQLTPAGRPLGTVAVPGNRLVTSFSSKSELALNLSPDGRTLSFMGY